MGTGPLHRPKLPGIPGIETFARPRVPHEPLGLRLHRRRARRARRWTKLARQARRHHRHRRDRGAVHPAARPRRQGAVRLPAHAVVDRRAQQPRDRPRVVRDARARLAAQVAAELRDAPDRRLRATRISSRTAGPTSRSASATASSQTMGEPARHVRRRDHATARFEDSDDEKMTEIRARVDERRARRGDRRGAQAVVPPALQAALLPRRVPAGLQRAGHATSSTPTARASSASTRPACGSAGKHYELDCLVFASGFEVGTELRAPHRLRDGRARRRHADRALGRRHAEPARHPRPRLPEPVHRRVRAGRQPDLERHAATSIEARHDDRRRRRARARDRRRRGRGDGRRRSRRGWSCSRERRSICSATPTARPATTTTRASRSAARERLNSAGYPQGPVAFFDVHRRVAPLGRVRGPGVPLAPRAEDSAHTSAPPKSRMRAPAGRRDA